nr:hypothetical protein KitaXyl93_76800 [Kitasatospora sp. Xyl93]
MRTLIDPLTPEESVLLRTVWEPFAKNGRFPTSRHVHLVLHRQGIDAAAVLRSLPVAQLSSWNASYRAVHSDRDGYFRPDGEVRLTLAALYHLRGDETADGICKLLLEAMRAAGKAQEYILTDPYATEAAEAPFAKVLAGTGATDELAQRAELIAAHEWPGLRISRQDANTRIESVQPGSLLPDADFTSVEEYLSAVIVAATPAPVAQPLPYNDNDPRALLRAFGVLDVSVELVLRIEGFTPRPPVDRSALLAFGIDDEDGLQTGITVLTEMLSKLKVGKVSSSKDVNSDHVLRRLEAWLAEALPGIDTSAVASSAKTFDSVREIRNSIVHPKPGRALLDAHQELGLPYPITDPTVAWDSIRAHTERALTRLYDAIIGARPGKLQ